MSDAAPIRRLALLGGEPYAPLYGLLPRYTRETGDQTEVATRLPIADLMAHLRLSREHGDVYDVVSGHSHYTASLAPRLTPLDDWVPSEELAAFDPEALAACRWEGRLYQLPRCVETRLLFYRSDIFDDRREQQEFAAATGGRELRVPQTWDELAGLAQYFTRAGRMYGYAFVGSHGGLVAAFAEILTAVGGSLFTAAGAPAFYTRAGEWALRLLADLYGRWHAVPPETPECREEEVSEAFRSGRCAMVADVPGVGRILRDPALSGVAGWHSVALLPGGPRGRAAWSGCQTFAIPADCPDPAGAARLLRFLTGEEAQRLEAGHGHLPTRTAIRDETRERQREGTLGHLRFTLAEQSLRLAALTPPPMPHYARAEEVLWPHLQAGVLGEKEPAAALLDGLRAVEAVTEPSTRGETDAAAP
jgi:multiple sugar transport system substrate-binding protein